MSATESHPSIIPISQAFEIRVEDIEYRRQAEVTLLARVYQPLGARPLAAVVDVHGGAWVMGDRTQHQNLDRALAANGVLVMSADFRQPPGNPYPTSIVDVNYAVRWLKQHLVQFGADAGTRVGITGGSSGGHVAILSAMRPRDPRYAALPLAGGEDLDASVVFAIADAPVTDPYARYLAAVGANNTALIERHHLYWPSDEAAQEGNPNLILARGESVELPPLFISQGTEDTSVPLAQTREFVDRYQQAGGNVRLLTFEGLGHGFILQEPTRSESAQQAEAVLAFIREHSG
jgi:acetyl esterase/lipase